MFYRVKEIICVFAVMILITSCKTSSGLSSNLDGAKDLFNGKDLNGWTIYGTEKWYAKGEQLICENGPDEAFGYLGTDKQYKNFELSLEYKQETEGNSGIFIHSTINGIKVTSGWQIEIAPPGHFTGGIHEYERGWLVKPTVEKDKAIRVKKWNQMKVRVEGNKLTSWLNGVEMATVVDEKLGATVGSIALQIHNGDYTKIHWRNIRITEL